MNVKQIHENLTIIIAKLGEIPIQSKYAVDMADCMVGLRNTRQMLNESDPESPIPDEE